MADDETQRIAWQGTQELNDVPQPDVLAAKTTSLDGSTVTLTKDYLFEDEDEHDVVCAPPLIFNPPARNAALPNTALDELECPLGVPNHISPTPNELIPHSFPRSPVVVQPKAPVIENGVELNTSLKPAVDLLNPQFLESKDQRISRLLRAADDAAEVRVRFTLEVDAESHCPREGAECSRKDSARCSKEHASPKESAGKRCGKKRRCEASTDSPAKRPRFDKRLADVSPGQIVEAWWGGRWYRAHVVKTELDGAMVVVRWDGHADEEVSLEGRHVRLIASPQAAPITSATQLVRSEMMSDDAKAEPATIKLPQNKDAEHIDARVDTSNEHRRFLDGWMIVAAQDMEHGAESFGATVLHGPKSIIDASMNKSLKIVALADTERQSFSSVDIMTCIALGIPPTRPSWLARCAEIGRVERLEDHRTEIVISGAGDFASTTSARVAEERALFRQFVLFTRKSALQDIVVAAGGRTVVLQDFSLERDGLPNWIFTATCSKMPVMANQLSQIPLVDDAWLQGLLRDALFRPSAYRNPDAVQLPPRIQETTRKSVELCHGEGKPVEPQLPLTSLPLASSILHENTRIELGDDFYVRREEASEFANLARICGFHENSESVFVQWYDPVSIFLEPSGKRKFTSVRLSSRVSEVPIALLCLDVPLYIIDESQVCHTYVLQSSSLQHQTLKNASLSMESGEPHALQTQLATVTSVFVNGQLVSVGDVVEFDVPDLNESSRICGNIQAMWTEKEGRTVAQTADTGELVPTTTVRIIPVSAIHSVVTRQQ